MTLILLVSERIQQLFEIWHVPHSNILQGAIWGKTKPEVYSFTLHLKAFIPFLEGTIPPACLTFEPFNIHETPAYLTWSPDPLISICNITLQDITLPQCLASSIIWVLTLVKWRGNLDEQLPDQKLILPLKPWVRYSWTD